LLLNNFFPIVDTCLSCEDIARQSCGMVPRWRFLATFLGPALAASRVQHISDLHSKFALGPHLGCLPYLHTWCGISANLGCRSETCCTRLAGNTGRTKSIKIAIWAPLHNFVGIYLRKRGMYRQTEKKLLNSNTSCTCPYNISK